MKNTKLFTSLAIAALAATFTFTSCEKTPVGPDYTLAVVDFEAANLSSEGYLVNDTYEEKGLTFVHNYTVNPGGSDYWNGFAVSNKTDETTPGMANQYSVYAASGAGGSAKFAVACEWLWWSLPRVRLTKWNMRISTIRPTSIWRSRMGTTDSVLSKGLLRPATGFA